MQNIEVRTQTPPPCLLSVARFARCILFYFVVCLFFLFSFFFFEMEQGGKEGGRRGGGRDTAREGGERREDGGRRETDVCLRVSVGKRACHAHDRWGDEGGETLNPKP